MKKFILILLLLLPIANAATISEWPDFFVKAGKFRAKYVVGEEAPSLDVISATVISTSLAKYENVTTQVGTSTLDIEISDVTKYDAVVIGSPCSNRAAKKLLNDPEPCYKDLGGSVGYIMIFEHGDKTQLLITGLDEKDRHAAAKYLAEADLSHLKVDEYLVTSVSGSQPPFFDKKEVKKSEASEEKNETVEIVEEPAVVEEPEIEEKPTPEVIEVGEYDALEELPEKRGFFASMWYWLINLFR